MIKTSNPSQLDYNYYQKSGDKHGNNDCNYNNKNNINDESDNNEKFLFTNDNLANSDINNNNHNNNNNDECMEIESQRNLKLFRKRSSASSARNSNKTHISTRNDDQLNKLDDDYIFKLAQNYGLMNKLLKEQNIYSDPKDNYKRRTISITRKPGTNYGFDLQVFIFIIKILFKFETILKFRLMLF